MRCILRAPKETRIKDMLNTLKWFLVYELLEYHTMILIYKIKGSLTPAYLGRSLEVINSLHRNPKINMKTCENLLEQKKIEVQQQIFKEFGKTEKDIQEYVDILKVWLKTQHHMPEIPSDGRLKQFLNLNKYSIEKVKQKIDMYYTVRTLIPEYFQYHPCSDIMKRQSELTYYIPLPKLTQNYCRPVYCSINEKCTVDQTDFDLYSVQALNALDILMHEDFAMGIVLICDCANFKAGHIPKFSLMTIKKAAFIMEKVYSNRINAFHIINAQPYIDIMITLAKSVMSQKLASRFHVHKTLEAFFEIIPREILPQDIGGGELPLKSLNDLWQEKFVSYKDRFDKLAKLKVNEELRPAPLVNDDVLGYHGNFKKLDVD